jgi:hypothetical protein
MYTPAVGALQKRGMVQGHLPRTDSHGWSFAVLVLGHCRILLCTGTKLARTVLY